MKVEHGLSGFALALMLSGIQASAQSPAVPIDKADKAEAKPAQKDASPYYPHPRYDQLPMQTFYLKNASQPNEGNELLTALRLMMDPAMKIYLTPSQQAITVRATPEDLAQVQRLIDELDRPKKDYRLNYTLTETDNGKRVGISHLSMVTSSGNRSTVKQGSKVPIVTGSYDRDKTDVQTQFTYLDVGINLDATVSDFAGGVTLKTKAEESSIAEEKSGVGTDPIVRQSVLDLVTNVALGKPMVLGSLDIQGSTRHLDIEVVVDQIK